jgi:thiol-disulfide isomerase/thioredoxin
MHKHSSCLPSAVLLLALFFQSNFALAQPLRNSTDDLFRKAGISKISQGAAVDFTLSDLKGNSVTLSTHRGSVVLLNFWATWCGPCRDEVPSLERLYRQFARQGLTMLAVNEKESATKKLWPELSGVARYRRQGVVDVSSLGFANDLLNRR